MVWLGAFYEGVTRPVIIEQGTINHQQYIQKILPLALKDGQRLMGDQFIFQQDGAPAHKDHNTPKWWYEYCWDFWPKSQ